MVSFQDNISLYHFKITLHMHYKILLSQLNTRTLFISYKQYATEKKPTFHLIIQIPY